MADTVVEHGGKHMGGTGAWLLLFFTITAAVIVGILILDLGSNLVSGTSG
jgi:hypothetical protein